MKLQPVRDFYKTYPEYKGKPIYFKGWSKRENKKWGNIQIRVQINKRNEFFDIHWFKDLIIK